MAIGQTMPAGWQAMQNMGALGTPQSSTGMQTPQAGGGDMLSQLTARNPQTMQNWGQLQPQMGAIKGMQRMPPPGAPAQGAGGGKGAGGMQGPVKQQVAQLPGAPPPGAPAQGPGGGKGKPAPAQLQQQIARLPGAAGAVPR
jgi:hypothetical protein